MIGSNGRWTAFVAWIALLQSCACGDRVGAGTAVLRVDPLVLEFDAQLGLVETKPLRLSNEGRATLSVSSVSLSGSEAFSMSELPTSIGAGDVAEVQVQFSPRTEGVESAVLAIETDGVQARVEVPLVGRSRSVDAGTVDGGVGVDAGVADAGVADSGVVDSGVVDSGVVDSGVADSGVVDSGVVDSGVVDSGVVDAGRVDPGLPDAGSPRCPGLLITETGCLAAESVVTSDGMTCAVSSDAGLWCWGWVTEGLLDDDGGLTLRPRRVPLDSGVLAVAPSTARTCIVSASHQVRCVGANNAGQLGVDASVTDQADGGLSSSRALITVPLSTPFASVSGTFTNHVCADPVDPQNDTYCWGFGDDGRIGNGTFDIANAPFPLPGFGRLKTTSAGATHTCAISSSGNPEGALSCWGSNSEGQLGIGTLPNQNTPYPLPVSVGLARQVSAGSHFTCAVFQFGNVKCWGKNDLGQTGRPPSVPVRTPDVVLGLPTASSVSAGFDHACAVAQGRAYCWGSNAYGQLGVQAAPAGVPTVVPIDAGVRSVSAGIFSTCASSDDGRVWCWGWNAVGQLGNGTTNDSSTPQSILSKE